MNAAKPTTPAFHLASFTREDEFAVIALEHSCFPDPQGSTELRLAFAGSARMAWVAKRDGDPAAVGYMLFDLPAGADWVRILRLAVHPAARRRAVGALLVSTLASSLAKPPEWRPDLFCDVRESNLGGQLFFKQLGFAVTCTKRGYFADTGEDALLFHRRVRGGGMLA
jgi:ribosomal-protein-alanine N-acetyltransferase